MLFVPASSPDMIRKAAQSAADGVCLDLEDSVAPAEKATARAHVVAALRELDFGPRVRIVRINGLDSPFAYRDVIEVCEAAGDRIDLVMLPKASGPRDVQFVETLLAQVARGWGRDPEGIRIEAQIESASGFLNVREIAGSSPRLDALVFGPGDFAASMQMPLAAIGERDVHDEIYPGHRWHSVMQTIVAAARAHGLRCMDGPYAGFRDTEGFRRSCRIARALGFDGKQCIHPAQVEAANTVFSPTPDEVAHARALVSAYEASVAAGQGAGTYDGRMIDAASLRMAQAILVRVG
jgi:citrate lyase subunit beta/citryl-CoA lyase